ncbi:MAG: T9SS type A sorting domain-containing protein [Candidatus Cloacimonadota bacterium]|nr:MAG: T9SS type A sorting domain-containing protein [Candidatus Cloacimonadota bacterium]
MKHFWIICLVGIVILISETNLFAQWEPDVRLTFDNASSHIYYNNAWQIAAIGDTVHVVWCDKRDGNSETYYKRSTDGGTVWETDTRLTDDPGNSEYSTIAVSGSKVHVVWEDDRDGNLEIYYKRNPTGNIGVKESFLTKITELEQSLKVYPNPFTTKISIKCSGIGEKQKVTLEIYDVSGRLIKSVPLTTNHLSLGADLLPGIYFLKADGKYVRKVVKVR